MRVDSINSLNSHSRLSKKQYTSVVTFSSAKSDDEKGSSIPFAINSFLSKFLIKSPQNTLPKEYNSRLETLKNKGVPEGLCKKFAVLDNKSYSRVLELLKEGVSSINIVEVISLDDVMYNQALDLTKLGIVDSFLFPLASQEQEGYLKTLDLYDKGFDSDALLLFSKLTSEEEQEAIKLLKQGYSPFVAANLVKLSEEQKSVARELKNRKIQIDEATQIAKLDEEKRKKAIQYLDKGIEPEFVVSLSSLPIEAEKKLPELISLDVGSVNLEYFAKLSPKDYSRMKELLSQGVQPDYITDILLIESGQLENKEYLEYRNRGYGYTTAFSISLLEDEKLDSLKRVIDANPEIKKLLKQECDVSVETFQYSETDEVIFEREFRTDNGTKINIVDTFYENGNTSKSRVEQYSDFSTSSTTSPQGNVYKIKYDKYGEIKELFEIVQDEKTKEVMGVLYSKASDVLQGVFDTVYYDISQFVDTNIELSSNIFDIEKAVIGDGIVLSETIKNDDGSTSYTEVFGINGYGIDRNYTEKRNEKTGEVEFSYYSYRIQNENDDEPVMNITRTFEKRPDGSVLNSINGIDYEITYDDENKIITITDGIRTKKYDVDSKLPYYSKDIIWDKVKSLQVDTIMTIFDYISKWNYCEDEDSAACGYGNLLSTGLNTDIILHESGHIKCYADSSILDDDVLLDTYGEEMDDYMNTIPFNEQEFTTYFSPRAHMMDADGLSEFVAETHIILNSFGTRYNKLKTRTQFLAKYFPRTVARVAELTGKNSTESLLK